MTTPINWPYKFWKTTNSSPISAFYHNSLTIIFFHPHILKPNGILSLIFESCWSLILNNKGTWSDTEATKCLSFEYGNKLNHLFVASLLSSLSNIIFKLLPLVHVNFALIIWIAFNPQSTNASLNLSICLASQMALTIFSSSNIISLKSLTHNHGNELLIFKTRNISHESWHLLVWGSP